jgi:hypothetical protein
VAGRPALRPAREPRLTDAAQQRAAPRTRARHQDPAADHRIIREHTRGRLNGVNIKQGEPDRILVGHSREVDQRPHLNDRPALSQPSHKLDMLRKTRLLRKRAPRIPFATPREKNRNHAPNTTPATPPVSGKNRMSIGAAQTLPASKLPHPNEGAFVEPSGRSRWQSHANTNP